MRWMFMPLWRYFDFSGRSCRKEFGGGPQWAVSLLAPLAMDFDAGGAQVQVRHLDADRLRRPHSGVVKEQQEGVVAPALFCPPIWSGK